MKDKTLDGLYHGCIFVFLVLALFVLSMPVHEYGHYWAATGLGLDAYIEGETTFIQRPPEADNWKVPIIYMAGGLFTVAVYTWLFFLFRRTYRYALIPTIAVNAFYFPFDAIPLAQLMGQILLFVFLLEVLPLYVRESMPGGRRNG